MIILKYEINKKTNYEFQWHKVDFRLCSFKCWSLDYFSQVVEKYAAAKSQNVLI